MQNTLRPFFCYYGGKWRAAPKYPAPEHNLIVEPFAGAAGYSLRYPDCKVVLVDKDPVIAGLWKYLIKVKYSEIMSLPVEVPGKVSDLDICQEAKWLIGFWVNAGAVAPCNVPSTWMRGGSRPNSYWGEKIRSRIANQLQAIRHWDCREGSYDIAPRVTATWFVDPPYQQAGKHYVHGSSKLEFGPLSAWCRDLWGQTIVCENDGAAWLPFVPFAAIQSNPSKNGKGKSLEAIWTRSAAAPGAAKVA